MTYKTKNKLKRIPSALAAALITGSAMAKMAGVPAIVQAFTATGILPLMRPLAIAEFLFITLFLLRKTMRVGFLLLTAYYGGAIAVEVTNTGTFIAPTILLTIIWMAAWLRNPALFIPENKSAHEFNIA